MKILFLSLLISMNIVTSCKQHEARVTDEKNLPQQTFLNVAYGADSLQKMDIHLPANRTAATTKSLVLIHGGGWNSGSKADFETYIDSFKKRLPDYAVFNINYRLVNSQHLFPTQEADVKAAMEFIVANVNKYHVSEDKLVLLGVSAGAHLALLQAYKYSAPKVQAVIDYFGPTDLITMYQKPWHPLVPLALQMITGTSPEANKKIFEQSSPVNFISSQSPATLIFHGGNDAVVDVSQSKLLAEKLKVNGVKHELYIYPGERHGRWYGNTLVNTFDRIEKFLKTNVH